MLSNKMNEQCAEVIEKEKTMLEDLQQRNDNKG